MDSSSFSDMSSFVSWYNNSSAQFSQADINALLPFYEKLLAFREQTNHLAEGLEQLKSFWSEIEKFNSTTSSQFFIDFGHLLKGAQAPVKRALKQATVIKEDVSGVESSLNTICIPEVRNKLLAVISATPKLNAAWQEYRFNYPTEPVEDMVSIIYIPPSEAKTKLSSLAQAIKKFKEALAQIGNLDKLTQSMTDYQNYAVGLAAKFNQSENEWLRLQKAGTEPLAAFFRKNLDKDMKAIFAWITPFSIKD